MNSAHTVMSRVLCIGIVACLPAVYLNPSPGGEPAVAVFKDGEAQVVKAFEDPDYWIRHDLWVETEFDSDGDNVLDRMHVSVTRPRQTESEGLKLPVVYVSSPYFAGTGPQGKEFF